VQEPQSNIVVESLKQALRRLAKAVAVVTAADGEVRLAMSATAICEVSLEPPSMLVCVNQRASIYPVLCIGQPFAINILHTSQADIASRCAGAVKGNERFLVGSWYQTAHGVPLLATAQASIVCGFERKIDHGTHGIFIGNVLDVIMSGRPDPLVYLDGGFAQVRKAGT